VNVDVAILGDLRVLVDDFDVTPRSPKSRALMASLALRTGEVVSVDRLIEELWPALPPDRARRVVQVRVAEIRKLLSMVAAGSVLEYVAPGYRLAVATSAVDAARFTDLVERARVCAGVDDSLGAATMLREALGLWRGEALADTLASRFLEAEAARLGELRLGAIEDRVDAELDDGCHQRLVAELGALVAAHPLRERLWAQFVVALYRSGRQTEALRACSSVRRLLVEQAGLEPGPSLRAVEAAVLAQDPDLDWRPRSPSARTVIPDPFESRAPAPGPLDDPPVVRYAKSPDGVNLAYQVVGEGPIDLVIVPGYISELDNWWEAWSGRLVRRLSSFSRLILFDKRGVGLSDRPERIVVEDWVEDVVTVLDAVGSVRPAVLGMSAGGKIAMLFAAIHPERTSSLIVYAASPRVLTDGTDYPSSATPEGMESFIRHVEQTWGTGESLMHWCPSMGDDPVVRAQFGQYERRSASPGSASSYLRLVTSLDMRVALPVIATPTLVIHPLRDRAVPIKVGRYLADHIAGAKLCELDTADHLIWFSEAIDTITDEVERFILEAPRVEPSSAALMTIVAVLIDDPAAIVRSRCHSLVHQHRGQIWGDADAELIAAFEGPVRSIQCALAIVTTLAALGVSARVGVHAGPCAVGRPPGSTVDAAIAIAATARRGQVVASSAVRDLAGGSAFEFSRPGRRDVGPDDGGADPYIVEPCRVR